MRILPKTAFILPQPKSCNDPPGSAWTPFFKDPDSAWQTIWRYQPTTFNKTKKHQQISHTPESAKKKSRTINAQSSKNWWNKLPPLLALSLLLLLLMALPAWLSWEQSGVQLPFLWVLISDPCFAKCTYGKKTQTNPCSWKWVWQKVCNSTS